MNKILVKFFKIILLFVFALLLYGFIGNKVEASNEPILEIKKDSYNESNKMLTVNINLKPGVKQYYMNVNYDSSIAEIVEVKQSSSQPISINNQTINDETIEILSNQATNASTLETTICKIKFQLNSSGILLEDDIPDDLFDIQECEALIVENEIDTDVSGNDLIKINKMSKQVASIVPNDDIVFSKTYYEEGEDVDILSGTININYTDNKTRVVDLITLQDVADTTGSKIIQIQKNGTWSLDSTTPYVTYIYKDVVSQNIDIPTQPITVTDLILSSNSVTLNCGQSLDLIAATVTPVMSNGTQSTTIALKDILNRSNINMQQAGTYSTTIEYEGITKNFTVIIVNPVTEIKLEESEKQKIQTDYKYNDEIVLNGAQLTIIRYNGAREKIDITKEMIREYNKQALGEQEIIIFYTLENKEIDEKINVNVKDYIVDIEVIKPQKTTYKPAEQLDLTGCTLKLVMASGNLVDPIPVTENMISGYNNEKFGTQRLKINYEDFEKYFNVIIVPQTGFSNTNTYISLIIIIEMSIIGIFMTLAVEKNEKIKMIQNVKKL